jgi:hypothetical protein
VGRRDGVAQRVRPLCDLGTITIYPAPMTNNVKYWTSVLHEAERELEAATTRAAMNAAAAKLMQAKVKLRRLQEKAPAAKA